MHHALDITIPDNILLLFQPAYSPQVNPIERCCQELQKQLRWQIFDNLDELRKNLSKYINELTPEVTAHRNCVAVLQMVRFEPR